MGTLHQIRPVILDEDGRDNEDEDGQPEFGDGDDGGVEGVCLHCSWWCHYEDVQTPDGHPARGNCRHDTPYFWTDTDWNDWCRKFELDEE